VPFAGGLWPMSFKWFADLRIEPLERFGNKVADAVKAATVKIKSAFTRTDDSKKSV